MANMQVVQGEGAARGCVLLQKLPREHLTTHTAHLLLTLSIGEVRDIIWQEVFVDQEMVIDTARTISVFEPVLLKTSRQIRAEAIKLYYNHTHFRLIVANARMLGPVDWLKEVPSKYRNQIKELTIHFERARYHAGWTYARQAGSPLPTYPAQSKTYESSRRVATIELLENLCAVRNFNRSIIKFDISNFQPTSIQASQQGAFACVAWPHFFIGVLKEMSGTFAQSELESGCPWCWYGWAEEESEDDSLNTRSI